MATGIMKSSPMALTRSSFLFPLSSHWIGVARLFDFGQSLNRYNYSPTPGEADYQSLLSDWMAVGDDLNWAIKKYEPEIRETTK